MKLSIINSISIIFFCIFVGRTQNDTFKHIKCDEINFLLKESALLFENTVEKDFHLEGGFLAWDVSYLMDAQNKLFELTKDTLFLNRQIQLITRIFKATDHKHQVKDYRNRIRKNWSSIRYSDSSHRVAFVVHTGLITAPILRFSEICLSDTNLKNQTYKGTLYTTYAKRFYKESKTIIHEHDKEWSKDKGTYVFAADFPLKITKLKNDVLPYNQYLAIAKSMLIMCNIKKTHKYEKRLISMVEHFKRGLEKDSINNVYTWKYHPNLSQYEDISHAVLDVNFAIECYIRGSFFTQMEIEIFANTINELIVNDSENYYLLNRKKVVKSDFNLLKYSFLINYNNTFEKRIVKHAAKYIDYKNFDTWPYALSAMVDYHYYSTITEKIIHD